MPFRKVSCDLKLAAIRMHELGILTVAQIIDCLQISRRTFYRVLQLWNSTGDVVQHTNSVRGHPRLHFDDIDYLKHIIKHRPNWFLDELLSLLETSRFISAHFKTIHLELVRAGISTKKLKKIAAERNEDLRADYIRHIAQYSAEQLGFIDEVSKDERTSARSRGRSKKGTRAVKKSVFVRGRRFSATGLLTIDGLVSNTVVEGSMTRDLFLEYLEFSVVCCCLAFWTECIYSCHCKQMPLCTPFPGYLSVLVMDNARIHHGEGIIELAERFRMQFYIYFKYLHFTHYSSRDSCRIFATLLT